MNAIKKPTNNIKPIISKMVINILYTYLLVVVVSVFL